MRDLFEIWKKKGIQILEQVAREQPGVLVKCMTLMMPKEMKIESAHTVVSGLSDDQLHSMIAELQERIAAKLSGADAKVINADAKTGPAALPRPAKEALWDITSRRKRNPKSTPEHAAVAARAAAQAAKTTDEPTPTPAT